MSVRLDVSMKGSDAELGMPTDDGCATMRSAARQPRRFWLAHRWSIGSCASPSEIGIGRDFSQTTSFSPAAGSTAVRGTGRIFHQLAELSAVVKRHATPPTAR